MTRIQPSQHFFRSQRLDLAYWSWGNPSLPTIVMQHGGRDHARSWDYLASELADQYHVVAPDLRGHGDSQWEQGGEYSIRQFVIDYISLLKRLDSPVHAIAHSFGGVITYLAAGTVPDRFHSIVSIEGRVTGHKEPMLTPEEMHNHVQSRLSLEQRISHIYPDQEKAAHRMRERNKRLSPELSLHLVRYGTRQVEGGFVWKFDDWARPGVRRDDISTEEIHAFMAAITCPVLLILGEQSYAQRGMLDINKHFLRGRAIVIPDTGHWVHLDAPERVLQEVRAHIAESI